MVFLVDGYNVIYQLKELRKLSVEIAKETLVGWLVNFSHLYDAQVVILFDGSDTINREQCITSRVKVIHCKAGMSADSMIECLVPQYKKDTIVYVVTHDLAEKRVAAGLGAICLNPKQFVEQLKGIASTMEGIATRRAYMKKKFFNRMEGFM